MKIALAQTRPIRGNIERNIENHLRLVGLAVEEGAALIIFPELSITGYEPKLAEKLATTVEDPRFDEFQLISNRQEVMIGIGVPIQWAGGITISLILFRPRQPRAVYSKKYLHIDEEPFFVSGANFPVLSFRGTKISFAICYELSVAVHSETASRNGAEVYIASVAKSAEGVERAAMNLSEIAKKFSILVLMANCVGNCEDFVGAGRSGVWDQEGKPLGQLDQEQEGLLILDVETGEVSKSLG